MLLSKKVCPPSEPLCNIMVQVTKPIKTQSSGITPTSVCLIARRDRLACCLLHHLLCHYAHSNPMLFKWAATLASGGDLLGQLRQGGAVAPSSSLTRLAGCWVMRSISASMAACKLARHLSSTSSLLDLTLCQLGVTGTTVDQRLLCFFTAFLALLSASNSPMAVLAPIFHRHRWLLEPRPSGWRR